MITRTLLPPFAGCFALLFFATTTVPADVVIDVAHGNCGFARAPRQFL